MAALIDTSFLVAVGSVRDANHIIARRSMEMVSDVRVIPAPVLPEMFYMLTKRVRYTAAMRMLELVRLGGFQVEPLTNDDMARMQQIMTDYTDNEFDFVDVALMAMAERLDICEIYTFDHRDFGIYRPPHCDFFELLP